MDPLTAALIGAAVGYVGGAISGWLFGRSRAQEEIEALQKLVLELVEVNRQREAEIHALKQHIDELEFEIEMIRSSRGFIARFIRWLLGEAPEVLERFREIEAQRQRAGELERQIETDTAVIDAEVCRLRELYPQEMALLEDEARHAR